MERDAFESCWPLTFPAAREMGTSVLKNYVLLAMLEAGAGARGWGGGRVGRMEGLLLEEDEEKLAEIVASPTTKK